MKHIADSIKVGIMKGMEMKTYQYSEIVSRNLEGVRIPKVFFNPDGYEIMGWLLSDFNIPLKNKDEFCHIGHGKLTHESPEVDNEYIIVSRRILRVSNNKNEVALYILLATYDQQKWTLSDIAKKSGISTSTVRRTLKKLQSKKLIKMQNKRGYFTVRFSDCFDLIDSVEEELTTVKKRRKYERKSKMFGDMTDGPWSEAYSDALIDWLCEVPRLQGNDYFNLEEIEEYLCLFGEKLFETGCTASYLSLADEMVTELVKHLQRPFMGDAKTKKAKDAKETHYKTRCAMLESGAVWISRGFAEARLKDKKAKGLVENKPAPVRQVQQSQPIRKDMAISQEDKKKRYNTDLDSSNNFGKLYEDDGTLTEEGLAIFDAECIDGWKASHYVEPTGDSDGEFVSSIKDLFSNN